MNKRFILIMVGLVFMLSFGVSAGFGAENTSAKQKGAFTVKVNGSDVTISASTGVYMMISIDDSDATTSATMGAIHGKGNYAFAMDTDGGPMYRYKSAVGTKEVPAIGDATPNKDNFAGSAASDKWTTF